MSISKARRIGYGAAELGVSGSEAMLRVSLLIYYTQVVGIRPDLASYAIALGVIWDAVTDPLMGRISDHACIRGEKRRPFLFPAAIGLATCLIFVFNVPELETQNSKFFYLLISYMGTNTFLTILSVPHTAFAGDLSKNPNIRMELFGWRLIFGNVGLILGTSIPAVAVMLSLNTIPPDATASWFVAAIIILGTLTTLIATSGLDCARPQQPGRGSGIYFYLRELGHVLSNRSFAWLLLAYMVATIGLTLNSSLALYYYKFFLKLDDVTVRVIIAFFMFIFCLAIPLWVWAARYVSKQSILIGNITLLGLMTIFAYPSFPPGVAAWPVVAGLFGGVFVGSVVLMDIAVADLADKQAKNDHVTDSNLGIYFGFWKMGSKFSRAIALVLTGNALTWIGFEAGNPPDQETSFRLALLFGPGVGLFLLASVVLIFFGQKRESL